MDPCDPAILLTETLLRAEAVIPDGLPGGTLFRTATPGGFSKGRIDTASHPDVCLMSLAVDNTCEHDVGAD
jgi:hypothetical protein